MSVLPDVVDVTPEVFIGSPYSSFLVAGSAMRGLAGGEDMASGTFIGLLRSSLVMAGSPISGLADGDDEGPPVFNGSLCSLVVEVGSSGCLAGKVLTGSTG